MRTLVVCLLAAFSAAAAPRPVEVLAWSERSEPVDIYPEGINGAIAGIFAGDRTVRVRVANLSDPEQGLSEAALASNDVLVWFGHRNHADVLPEAVERVVRHVTERGMGYLPLHSGHYAYPFVELMKRAAAERGVEIRGRVGGWGAVRNKGQPERVKIVDPAHPAAKGLSDFTIPATEEYANPFGVPPPDGKVFEGAWEGGEQRGSDGMYWRVGRGRVFYFRPGHETYPIFRQAEVRQAIRNIVMWLGAPADK